LLKDYSSVAPEDVSQHVHNIRDKAWAIRPYPCTGMGNFLDSMLAKSVAYPTIIARLKAGDSLLDIGCYLGQDLRRLVLDGAPATNLYGVDIVNYWDLGYEMFRNGDKLSAKFMEGNVLHLSTDLEELVGKVDILSVTHVLHQWEWEGQVAAAKELSLLVRPGGMVVGFQVGTAGGKSKQDWDGGRKTHDWMKQDAESWRRMWALIGETTGTKWSVDTAQLRTFEELGHDPKEVTYLGRDARILKFIVTRIQ
ncbi:uncharacterized protein LY89DRAFT_599942, partial [Mollisia scopiformis]